MFPASLLVCAVRALAGIPSLLIASAFVGGFLFSFYAVSIAPTVAQLTTDRARPFGFSLFFSLGIGIGVLAGLAGGRLPCVNPAPERASGGLRYSGSRRDSRVGTAIPIEARV